MHNIEKKFKSFLISANMIGENCSLQLKLVKHLFVYVCVYTNIYIYLSFFQWPKCSYPSRGHTKIMETGLVGVALLNGQARPDRHAPRHVALHAHAAITGPPEPERGLKILLGSAPQAAMHHRSRPARSLGLNYKPWESRVAGSVS